MGCGAIVVQNASRKGFKATSAPRVTSSEIVPLQTSTEIAMSLFAADEHMEARRSEDRTIPPRVQQASVRATGPERSRSLAREARRVNEWFD
jgi:hypothetical protein